jgi:hypothetical protein
MMKKMQGPVTMSDTRMKYHTISSKGASKPAPGYQKKSFHVRKSFHGLSFFNFYSKNIFTNLKLIPVDES